MQWPISYQNIEEKSIAMIKEEFAKIFEESLDTVLYDYELSEFVKDIVLKNRGAIPPVFRYSPADYYNIRGLETQSLFLTPVGNMNDVFEGISCEITDEVINKIERLGDIAYLKSFSEENNNLLLWAHYAQNYSGMCIEYDFSKLPEELLYHFFPVYYSSKRLISRKLERAIVELEDLKKMNADNCYPNDCDFIKDIMSLFLTKSPVWNYEKEWRIVATHPQIFNVAEDLDDDQEAFYHINGQQISVAGCIKSVYLGPQMKQNIKEHIVEICRGRLGNIPVYSTNLSKDKYELEYSPIP